MLPTLIQRYDKNHFIFDLVKKTRDKLKLYRLSDGTFYDRINTIYQFIKPFLDKFYDLINTIYQKKKC